MRLAPGERCFESGRCHGRRHEQHPIRDRRGRRELAAIAEGGRGGEAGRTHRCSVGPVMTGGSAEIAVRRLPPGEGLPLPGYATAGAAAMDLLAAVDSPLVLAPGARAAVPTGLMVALPSGHELQIRPRSGLALNHGLLVANSPGTVDEDYRGEIKVILLNTGDAAFTVTRGLRIAQAVLAPVLRAVWQEVSELD